MDATQATVPDYPWEDGVRPGEFQCVYCGRYMKDRRVTRVTHELGYKLHACIACHLILSISRGLSFEGKKKRVQEILRIQRRHPVRDDLRAYVNREGMTIWYE